MQAVWLCMLRCDIPLQTDDVRAGPWRHAPAVVEKRDPRLVSATHEAWWDFTHRKPNFMEQLMRDRFEKLAKDFCSLVKLPDPAHVMAGQAFDAEGVACTLNYDDLLTRDRCFLFADCGPTGPGTPPALYHDLLVRNFNNFSGSGVGFGIAPKTGHIFYAEPISLASATAEQLLNSCLFAAEQAQELRKQFPAAVVKK